MLPRSLFDPTAPALIKRSQTLPPGKANAQRLKIDRPSSAPLPLSQREQQVCEYLSDGLTFEVIARHLGFSPAAAKEYYSRALSKLERKLRTQSTPEREIPSALSELLEQALAKPQQRQRLRLAVSVYRS
jgi:DNA-binding CsgD family transcriptional regulator